MRAINIIWDTDGISVDDLPEEVNIPEDEDTFNDEDISDYLSDVYGWCVKSFDIAE